jgi:hypothetical protein
MSDEDKKYLAEKHNKGVFVNDCTHDWGGCPSTYEDQPEPKNRVEQIDTLKYDPICD